MPVETGARTERLPLGTLRHRRDRLDDAARRARRRPLRLRTRRDARERNGQGNEQSRHRQSGNAFR